jgi:predicted nucleic acid-binding protein
MSLVLDNSVAMLWLLPQSNPAGIGLAEQVLALLQKGGACVPSLWSLEASNVISKSQRLGRITQAQASAFVSLLDALSISIDINTAQHALHATLDLARQFGLSAYDAAYLELALRENLPLATLDKQLQAAAREAGVELIAYR